MESKISSDDVLKKFKESCISFIDDLLQILPNEPDFIILRVFFSDQIPIKVVIQQFIICILPFKKMIQERNEQFFLKNESMFGDLSATKVFHFKTLWNSGKLDKDDKDAIWKWFDHFINLIERYQSLVK